MFVIFKLTIKISKKEQPSPLQIWCLERYDWTQWTWNVGTLLEYSDKFLHTSSPFYKCNDLISESIEWLSTLFVETPFGQLPVLEIAGAELKKPFVMDQTYSILRHLAHEFGELNSRPQAYRVRPGLLILYGSILPSAGIIQLALWSTAAALVIIK